MTRTALAVASPPVTDALLQVCVFALVAGLATVLIDMYAGSLDTYTAGRLAWLVRLHRRVRRMVGLPVQ